jgi:sec-independent protein translocase protein TatA
MGNIGFPELVVIFIVALLVFGPRKLPELGRSLGRGISEFRRASSDLKTSIEREIENADVEAAIIGKPSQRAPNTGSDAPKP